MDIFVASMFVLKVFHYTFLAYSNIVMVLTLAPMIFSSLDWSNETKIRDMLIAPVCYPFRSLPNIQFGLFAFRSDFIMGWSLLCIVDSILEAVIKHG